MDTVSKDPVRFRSAAILDDAWSLEGLKRLAQGVPEPFAYVDRRLRYRFVNDRYSEFLGLSRTSILGRGFAEVVGPDTYRKASPFVERVLAGEEVSFELHKAGPRGGRWLSVAYRPDRGPGEILGFFVLVTDITKRKSAQAAARRESDLNHALLDTVGALVVVLDVHGRIVRFNQSCEEITGYTFREVRGRRVWDLFVPPEQVEAVRSIFEELRHGNFPNEHENEWLTRAGERRSIKWTNTSVRGLDDKVQYVVGTGLDVTDQHRAEAQLLRNREELRQLNSKLISVQEEFSSRLARELHDGLGQRVAALALQVSALRRNEPWGSQEPSALRSVQAEIEELGRDIRTVSHQLHPMILKDLGLKAAVENECRLFGKHHGIAVACQVTISPGSLSYDGQLALYRIVQEALGNIGRHSGASAASVVLEGAEGGVVLRVGDNGCGFDESALREDRLGLISMRERAHAVGGECLLESAPGKGTRVKVRVPVSASGC